jgi:hypothetical protein
VKKRAVLLLTTFALTAVPAVDPAALVRARIKQIQTGRSRPGTVFTFTSSDLNAYARSEAAQIVPEGLRQPRLELGNGSASAFAFIDFLRIRHAQGENTPWLIAKLIEGERPIRVQTHIQSGGGKATIFLDRVEISGVAVTGSTLNFLIDTFFHPLYPDAKINQPFELADRVDRIEVTPSQARVLIGK